jgi:hypothetical protein
LFVFAQKKKGKSGGLFYFYGKDSLIGVKDKNGKIVIPADYNNYSGEDISIPIKDNIIFLYKYWNMTSALGYERHVYSFDRKGKFLFHPYWFDNGPDYLQEGLMRFVEGSKMGFADGYGSKKIPAVYNYVSSFNYGVAFVCKGCRFFRDSTKDPEHNMRLTDGKWSIINKEGKILMSLPEGKADYKVWDSLEAVVGSFTYTPYEKIILKKIETVPGLKQLLIENWAPAPNIKDLHFHIVDRPSHSFPYYLVKPFLVRESRVTDLDEEFVITKDGRSIYRNWNFSKKKPLSEWMKREKD